MRVALIGLAALAQAAPLGAAGLLLLSPDVTLSVDGSIVADEDAVSLSDEGAATSVDLGPLPVGVEVTAFHSLSQTERLFAVDTTAQLGDLPVVPGDIVRWDGQTHTLYYDALSAGLPAGLIVDALTLTATGELVVSFETTAVVGNVLAADEDLVRITQSGASLELDGSKAGVPQALDIDAADALGGGRYALSFDTGGKIAGVVFEDEDVLLYDPSGGGWSLLVDGSELDPSLRSADAQAIFIPEPVPGVAGAAALLALAIVAGLPSSRRLRRGLTLQASHGVRR